MDVKKAGSRGGKKTHETRSKAEVFAYSMMGGPKRKKDLNLSVLEYFAMGMQLKRRIEDAGMDGKVYVIGSARDYYALSSKPRGLEDLDAASRLHGRGDVIGLVVYIWDTQNKKPLIHARPFIVSKPTVAKLLEQAVEDIRQKEGR